MDILFAQIQADLRSNDALRQSGALLQALQQSAAGRDISIIAKSAVEEIVAAPASAISKKLAFDLIRSTRLTADLWETVCTGIRNDLEFPDPDVTAAAVSILAAIPSFRLGKLIADCNKQISSCFDSSSDNLRFAITETLGCILARDDLVTLCENNMNLLDRVSNWWTRIGQNMLDNSDTVSKVAFESVGRLFQEFESKRMSRLAGDKLVDSENSVAIRSNWVSSMVDFVWKRRNAVMARSLILPVESFRATIFPLVYAVKAMASGSIDVIRMLSRSSKNGSIPTLDSGKAEKFVGVSDVASHLAPFLASSLDPALIFEVGINMLYLADVSGGKPEWASTSIIAILTLWDRQEFSSARESIVRAVVTNLHLLDLSMQVSLFKRLLLMVRNLRAESDRMHALACICRTALCVDLFAKESVRRGQKPLPGTDIASLFEDGRIKDDLNSVTRTSLFREELVAMLVESCFQLSLPLPEQKNSGMESRVIGALAYGTGYGALNWTEPALEVVEVCRPCVKWDCEGRTYAIDCYLKLLVRLCHIYDTRGGIKRVKDGASQDQILNETRLQNLQRELVRDLREVNTPRISARLLFAISEHIDLEGLDPLLADDPEDPLNIIISNTHKVLFNIDSSASTTNRLQDLQAVLLCAQRLGSRNARAAQLLTKELEEFRSNALADSVNKHQCRLILQRIKYATSHPESKWAGVSEARGDYPFSHHKLTVQFHDASAAQDRKLEGLVHKAILELWRPEPNELAMLLAKGIDSSLLKVPPSTHTLTGSSDPCYVEAYHLTDPSDGRITLHLKVLNLTEIELSRVDLRVGLSGGLYFMDGSPQAVRQLRDLNSQEPVLCSVTVGVSHFKRCDLWVQVLYYPFYGTDAPADYEGEYSGEDPQIIKQKRSLKELGEPVILRCQPYKIPLTEFLLPHKISPVEYFRLWPSLPAIVEYTGAYTYEGSGFKATAAQQYGASPFLSGLKSLSSKPFHRVCSHIIRTVAGFQLCFAAKTWYGGFVGMMVFGASEVSRNVDLGDETTTMMCKFVIRASDASITKEIDSDPQGWLDDLTDGGVEYMPEDEVKVAAADKLKISMERIALLKAARPRKTAEDEEEEDEDDNDDDKEKDENGEKDGKHKGPTTLFKLTAEEVEHRALQTAVIQEWLMLCKDRSTKEPVLCSVTVGVSHFKRCDLWVQVLYYPFYGTDAPADYEGEYSGEDPQIIKQKRSLKELGEPVILRCQPYKIPLTEFLLPHKISPVEYFRLWPSLPAIVEYTGAYTYEGSGFKATAAQQYGASPFLSGLKSLSSKPFHRVCSHIIRTVAGFQLCFAAKTWYGGFVGMMVFGASEVSRNVDLGDETTTMMCKFVIRASDASITKEIDSDPQGWLDDLTDGGVEYMPEDEVKVAAADKLKISMERIALLKAARPRKTAEDEEEEDEDDNDDDKEKDENGEKDGKHKGPTTLFKLTAEEVEHRALQTAVIQEWLMLCKDRSTKVN